MAVSSQHEWSGGLQGFAPRCLIGWNELKQYRESVEDLFTLSGRFPNPLMLPRLYALHSTFLTFSVWFVASSLEQGPELEVFPNAV